MASGAGQPPNEEKLDYNHEFGTTASQFKDLTDLDRPVYRSVVTGPSPLDAIYKSVGHADLLDTMMDASSATAYGDPDLDFGLHQTRAHKKSLELPSLHSEEGLNAPPAAPKWIEPHHNFRTSSNADLVMEKLKDILNDMRVDHIDRDNKFKLICVAYKKGGAISFVVRIFSVKDEDKDKFLVEVQRRTGDVFHFSELYYHIKAQLQKSGLVGGEEVTEHPHSPLSPSSDDYMWDVSDAKQAHADMKNLLEMCASKYVDVKAEGLRALCHLSSDQNVHSIMVELGAVDICCEALASAVEDVHRCALTILANLIGSPEVGSCGDICLSFLNQRHFGRVETLAHSSCKEVMRECARLLANLATVSQSQAKQGNNRLKTRLQEEQKPADGLVTYFKDSADPRVRQCGHTLSAAFA